MLNNIINRSYTEKQLNDLVEKDYFIFIYKITPFESPFPVFWNTQIIIPDSTALDVPDGTRFQKLTNGWYVINKKSYENKNGLLYELVSLIPVKWSYYVENKYLQNSFVAVDNIQNEYDISLKPTGAPIKDINGEKLFYIQQISDNIISNDNIFSLVLRILAALLVLFFIHKLAKFYFERNGFWPAFFILIIPVLLLRIASYYLPIPLNFRQLELFDPSIYASNFVLPSLGDLLINSFLFIWIVLFIRFHFRVRENDFNFETNFKKYAAVAFISLLMVGITLMCGNIVRSLVFDSQISFDVINFFTLNIYSVIGFIVLSCVATGYFFLIQILFQPVKTVIRPRWFVIYLFIAIIGLLFLTLRLHSAHASFNFSLLAWLLFFMFLLDRQFLSLQAYNLISSRFIFWLFFFSVSITAAIVLQNRKKELEQRKHFAENLANKADPANEVMMKIILTDFRNEVLLQLFNRLKRPAENKFLKDSLVNENFTGYLNKYDTKIYTFNANELPLYNEDSINFNSLNTIVQTQGKPTGIPGLYYYDVSYDRFNYISKKEIADTLGRRLGYIFIVSKPKKFKSDALYPELFSKGNGNSIESSSVYAFAVYNNRQLNTSNNDYPFPTTIDPTSFTYNEFRTVNRNGYEELWYRANENKVIVIARQDNFFIESITLFAYLFCSFLVITIIFNLLNKLVGGKMMSGNFKSFLQFTIRNQVHGTIITISIFSFLVIGVTTILFFISRYHSNNREKLSRTIHVMENEIRNSIDTISMSEIRSINFDSLPNGKLEEIINQCCGHSCCRYKSLRS